MYSSFYLIRKDFILVRKFLLLLIPYYIIMGYTNLDAYTMFALFPSMLMLMNACTLDMQHHNQRLLVTLPLPRQHLVLAKYLSMFPYAVISLIFTLLLYLAGQATGQSTEPMAWRELAFVVASFPILAAIYLPLYYWLGQKGMQLVNMVFIMLIMFSITAMTSLTKRFSVSFDRVQHAAADTILLPAIGVVAYLFLLYCSYLISLRIFIKKDI